MHEPLSCLGGFGFNDWNVALFDVMCERTIQMGLRDLTHITVIILYSSQISFVPHHGLGRCDELLLLLFDVIVVIVIINCFDV